MSSGPNLPIPGAEIAPLNPGEGEGTVAGDVQPGEGAAGDLAPDGSAVIPGEGTPGSPVAQPGEGAVVPPVVPGEPRPGQSAEERIQGLVTEVNTLKTQLADVEDIRDLADELDEVLVALRSGQPVTPTPATPTTVPPGQPARPAPPAGVEGQIAQLTQTVQNLQGIVQQVVSQPDEAAAYKAYEAVETKVLNDSGITNPTEVSRVKEMINREMDAGKHDWTRPRVAKRVIRGQVADFQKLKSDLITASVGPATTPAAPAVVPGQDPNAVHQVTPESDDVDPLDQAHQELGPLLDAMLKKGGGVI